MIPHTITLFGKEISYTEKSIFRVEIRPRIRDSYAGEYAHKDPVHAIRYFNNMNARVGALVRLIKDGDEFIIIQKKQF